MLGRLHFLGAGFLLYSIGSLLAALDGYVIKQTSFVLGYLVLFFSQLSLSYSNDYFDVSVDKLGEPTLFSGGAGILSHQPHLMKTARMISLACIFLSLAVSILLMIIFDFGPLVVLFAAAGNFLGWYYSAPPLKLAYRGWGEISTAIASGFFMPAFGNFMIAHQLTTSYLLLMLPLLMCGLMFIISVEVPDMEADRAGGKMNLVARIGRRSAFLSISLIGAVITVYFFCLAIFIGGVYLPIAIMSLLPFTSGVMCWFMNPLERGLASLLSMFIVISLMVFLIGCDIYLFAVI